MFLSKALRSMCSICPAVVTSIIQLSSTVLSLFLHLHGRLQYCSESSFENQNLGFDGKLLFFMSVVLNAGYKGNSSSVPMANRPFHGGLKRTNATASTLMSMHTYRRL
ncbi:hypothetical protein FB446DRAFT_37049 [Lentinula raphanica]|nr:hypothetical protein FB446DRAFT_37049 [Lentinula raphanica]